MKKITQKITPFLWFQSQAEEAAEFYVSVFSQAGLSAKITDVTHYPKSTEKVSGKPAGSVMTLSFELAGQNFTAINGGEPFKLSEAFSLVINCEDQAEIDYFWEKLGEGGDKEAQICGWLKDKFGLSWQITPKILPELLNDADPQKVDRVMKAVLSMKKIEIAKLQEA
jgi:predicted 3-demethylubiquinone-9 3-methyltransferase (glyoxalase superfamily)